MKLHISHGARNSDDASDVDWFVVKPLDGETTKSIVNTDITHDMAVMSLLRARRAVYEVDFDKMTVVKVKYEHR
ncbi:MAG TPA: hypothetical protein VNS88_09760 [Nitrospiraceae bacterium]|nr:hypothetical protein [Nitrospiraceae bacterium]